MKVETIVPTTQTEITTTDFLASDQFSNQNYEDKISNNSLLLRTNKTKTGNDVTVTSVFF